MTVYCIEKTEVHAHWWFEQFSTAQQLKAQSTCRLMGQLQNIRGFLQAGLKPIQTIANISAYVADYRETSVVDLTTCVFCRQVLNRYKELLTLQPMLLTQRISVADLIACVFPSKYWFCRCWQINGQLLPENTSSCI